MLLWSPLYEFVSKFSCLLRISYSSFQPLPRLRFNKEGNLLAVTTVDNGFKILANAAGLRSIRAVETPSFEALRTPVDSAIKVTCHSKLVVCFLRHAFWNI